MLTLPELLARHAFKAPRRIFAIDAYPVTFGANATKTQKHKLRDMAQQLMRG